MRMLCLDASRRLWSGPSQMNIVHDDHSHVGALTEGGNHDFMVCKGSVPNHRGATDSERRCVSDRAVLLD